MTATMAATCQVPATIAASIQGQQVRMHQGATIDPCRRQSRSALQPFSPMRTTLWHLFLASCAIGVQLQPSAKANMTGHAAERRMSIAAIATGISTTPAASQMLP